MFKSNLSLLNISLHISFRKYIVFIMLGILSIIEIGCGKKAPPQLPVSPSIPAVSDLTFEIVNENTVKLSWSVPPNITLYQVKGFRVYRVKTTTLMTECKKCPVLFEKLSDIPLSSEPIITYSEKIEMGFRYRYKVTAYTQETLGIDSNIIEFVY